MDDLVLHGINNVVDANRWRAERVSRDLLSVDQGAELVDTKRDSKASIKGDVAKTMGKAKKADYTITSVFSGVCGLDMGFEGGFEYKGDFYKKNSFKVIGAFEKDEKCVATISVNLQTPICQAELTPEKGADLPHADVLIGGFPCQDFSSCGPKRGLSSERGQLYKVLISYMKKHRPMIVCGENVPHLARMHNGEVIKTIIEDLRGCGYKVQVWDLFAPDYGVPQNRRRLFFVCTRDDLPGEPIRPKARFAENHRSTKWAISDLERVTTEKVPNQSQYFKASKALKGNGQGDEKCSAELPSYTIRANAKSRVQFHYKLNRRLTVRECARLQTFPDTFIFPHSGTTNIMQIGNAVPPILAHAVGAAIEAYLRSIEDE